MATILNPPSQNTVLHNVSWQTYECLLADFANSSAPRFTYDRGTLEIMSPLPEHERRNRILSLLVEVLAEERNQDIQNLGSTTFRREDLLRGFEPDSCFYIQNADAIDADAAQIDLGVDPPPDLVIEIDITHPSLDKFPLYASIGVPEIWRDDGETVQVFALQGEAGYVERGESLAFPGLTGVILSGFAETARTLKRTAWLRSLREWARRSIGS